MSKSSSERRLRRNGDRERAWRQAIADQERSGESIRAFCRQRELQEASFYHWRREIRLRDRESDSKGIPPVLAPVVVVDGPLGESATSIEIVLTDGTTVRVPPGSTRDQLVAVFAVLEPARC